MNLTIGFTPDLDSVVQRFRGFEQRLPGQLQDAATQVAETIVGELQSRNPTAQAIDYTVEQQGQGIRVLFKGSPVLRFVIRGTRAHEIVPHSPNGVLSFVDGGGDLVFTQVVHHPGTAPDDFPAEVMQQSQPDLIEAVKAALLGALQA